MGYHWLQTAVGNTANPNTDYQSFLESRGIYTDPSKVGDFFKGISEDYQEDVGMARAGFAQGMQGAQMQGQQSAMQLGGGQGLASIGGGGFGRQGYGMQQGLGAIGQQYGQGLQSGLLGYTQNVLDAQRGMESQFMDVATGLLESDSAGIGRERQIDLTGPGYGGDTWNPHGWTGGDPNEGAAYVDGNGQNWIFRGGRWREA